MRLPTRWLGAVAATMAVAAAVAMPAAAVPPIDTTSTTGVHIETVPSASAATAVVVGGSDSGWVALSTSVWRATGYPEPVVPPNNNPNLSVLAISDTNIVAGNYLVNGVQRRAFVLHPDGAFLTLNSPPGDSGVLDISPIAVADDGTVVGTFHAVGDTCRNIAAVCGFMATPSPGGDSYSVETFTTPEEQPFLPTAIGGTGDDIIVAGGGATWTPSGGYQDLLGVAPGRPGTARSISANGALAGTVSPEDGVVQAAYWASPDASPVAIPAVGSDVYGFARDLNERDQVVGWSGASSSPSGTRHAFVWDAVNGTVDLGTLPGGTSAEAMAITEDGRVAGESDDRPVLWDLDGDADLDHPPEVGIVSLPPRDVDAGDPVVIELVVTDPEGDPYEFVIDGLPGGSFDATTDTFRWDTGPGDDGTYSFTFTVRQIDDPTNAYVLPVRLPLTVHPGDFPDPIAITLTESVTVSDDVVVELADSPVTISIAETVTISDEVVVTPPVLLVIDEMVTVSDGVRVRPSVLLDVEEQITIDDAVSLLPSVRLLLEELVQVTDDVGVDADRDRDGDGIDDVIDGRFVGAAFASDVGTFSDGFTDRHRPGTTYGTILDRGVLEPRLADIAGDGVRVTTGVGAAAERADFDLCGLPGRARVLPKSSVVIRCGSLFATVEAGGIEIELSDGSVLVVDAPGSVVVRDDGSAIEIKVFVGPVRLLDGSETLELDVGDVVTRPEQSGRAEPLAAPGSGSPAPSRPAAPSTGPLAFTGSWPVEAMVLVALSAIVVGAGAAYAGRRRTTRFSP